MKIIHELPPKQPQDTMVALDLEMFNLNPKQMHRPISGEFGCLSIATDPDTVYIIDSADQVQTALDQVQDATWAFHNAKFDLAHLRRWATIQPCMLIWDTMLIDRIRYNGYFGAFALDDLARRYLNMYLDKSLQKSFEGSAEMTPAQIVYAATDASCTLKIALKQRKKISKTNLDIWYDIDLPTLWAVLDFQGFAINMEAWKALAELNQQRHEELEAQLPFNPRSPAQVKKALISAGFKGLPNTRADVLQKKIQQNPDTEAAAIAQMVLDSRKYGKRASTYGMNFIEDFLEQEDGYSTIYTSYDINRAETGRFASSDPNMQNIPARETKEFRECFIARPGHKLIIADYSAQEPRILAYLSQDKKLIEIFRQGRQVYIESAKMMFDEDIEKGSLRYGQVKAVVLGIPYGLSKYGLAENENMDVEEADELILAFFHAFPGVAHWMRQQRKLQKKVKTVSGRTIWLNPYSSQCENNATNGPDQGTASDMIKKALARTHREWRFDCPYGAVAQVHDELVFDVPEHLADEVAEFVQMCMEEEANAMCPGVPFVAEAVITDTWAGK